MQTLTGSKECSHSKMGTSVEFIIAQSMVQREGTMCSKGGPDIAATNSPGDHMFCHRQSGGTTCSAMDSLEGPLLGGAS